VSHRNQRAFTLIEMLVVVVITGFVLTFAANFYLDLSAASQAAVERTVGVRRATTVLDRVARDLEAAVLVTKPESVDPLDHPWIFLAESSGRGEGAERLKFQTRGHRPRAGRGHESDLVVIAYWLAPAEDGETLELLRWASPRLPERLDRTFPRRDDEGVELLASGVASFGVRLQNEDGAWSEAWDSSTLVDSSALPLAAEVKLAFAPEASEAIELAFEAPDLPAYQRPVLIAQRPLDLEAALEGEAEASAEKDGDLGCVTVNECVSRNQELVAGYAAENPGTDTILQSIGDECWADHATTLPVAVSNCE
jgi:prepilin-type N-terminal cleavage/methylation domain-containing protein